MKEIAVKMTRLSEMSTDSIDEVSIHESTRKFAKHMLRNSLFIGTFQEKRFVESLNAYRDVITIANEETKFIRNLLATKKRIDEEFLKKPWVGITEPSTIGAPVGYNLWVELREEVFGKYWYRVRTVKFLQKEIRLELEVMRPVKKEHSSFGNTSSNETSRNSCSIDDFDFRAYFKEIHLRLKQNLIYFYTVILTFENIKQSVIFISLLTITLVTGLVSMLQYLLEYILKLIRELSGFMKAVSPVLIACVNLIGKTIFGFYSLIVAMYRGKPTPQPVYNSYVNFDSRLLQDPRMRYNQYFAGQLPYYPASRPSGVTITPIEYH